MHQENQILQKAFESKVRAVDKPISEDDIIKQFTRY
jgi:hypothetical protein